MINIRNSQRSVSFSVVSYQKKAEKILEFLGYLDFDLGIWLTTNATMKKYNQKFRHKNKATDVLSFPYHTDLKAGRKIKIDSDEDKNLGDIMISVQYVLANEHNLNGDFNERMDFMLVHGICHLLGYDHEHDTDFKKMNDLEKKLLRLIA